MPEFKNSGTGYTEHKQGSSAFPEKRKSPEGSSGEPQTEVPRNTPNPNPRTGPQVY
jgi:hypothetical protein